MVPQQQRRRRRRRRVTMAACVVSSPSSPSPAAHASGSSNGRGNDDEENGSDPHRHREQRRGKAVRILPHGHRNTLRFGTSSDAAATLTFDRTYVCDQNDDGGGSDKDVGEELRAMEKNVYEGTVRPLVESCVDPFLVSPANDDGAASPMDGANDGDDDDEGRDVTVVMHGGSSTTTDATSRILFGDSLSPNDDDSDGEKENKGVVSRAFCHLFDRLNDSNDLMQDFGGGDNDESESSTAAAPLCSVSMLELSRDGQGARDLLHQMSPSSSSPKEEEGGGGDAETSEKEKAEEKELEISTADATTTTTTAATSDKTTTWHNARSTSEAMGIVRSGLAQRSTTSESDDDDGRRKCHVILTVRLLMEGRQPKSTRLMRFVELVADDDGNGGDEKAANSGSVSDSDDGAKDDGVGNSGSSSNTNDDDGGEQRDEGLAVLRSIVEARLRSISSSSNTTSSSASSSTSRTRRSSTHKTRIDDYSNKEDESYGDSQLTSMLRSSFRGGGGGSDQQLDDVAWIAVVSSHPTHVQYGWDALRFASRIGTCLAFASKDKDTTARAAIAKTATATGSGKAGENGEANIGGGKGENGNDEADERYGSGLLRSLGSEDDGAPTAAAAADNEATATMNGTYSSSAVNRANADDDDLRSRSELLELRARREIDRRKHHRDVSDLRRRNDQLELQLSLLRLELNRDGVQDILARLESRQSQFHQQQSQQQNRQIRNKPPRTPSPGGGGGGGDNTNRAGGVGSAVGGWLLRRNRTHSDESMESSSSSVDHHPSTPRSPHTPPPQSTAADDRRMQRESQNDLLRLEAQLSKSTQRVRLLEGRLAMLKESSDSVIKSLNEELDETVEERCRMEVNLMKTLHVLERDKAELEEMNERRVRELEETINALQGIVMGYQHQEHAQVGGGGGGAGSEGSTAASAPATTEAEAAAGAASTSSPAPPPTPDSGDAPSTPAHAPASPPTAGDVPQPVASTPDAPPLPVIPPAVSSPGTPSSSSMEDLTSPASPPPSHEELHRGLLLYLLSFQNDTPSNPLVVSTNAILDAELNDRPETASDLVSYYQSRKNLRDYTLKTEVPRMEYRIRVTDRANGRERTLRTADEIQSYFGYKRGTPGEEDGDDRSGNDAGEDEEIDLLLRSSNQSLLADALQAITGDGRLVQSSKFHATAIATRCEFRLDLRKGEERHVDVHCGLVVSLPYPGADATGRGTEAGAAAAASAGSGRLQMGRVELNVHFSPASSRARYRILKLEPMLKLPDDAPKVHLAAASLARDLRELHVEEEPTSPAADDLDVGEDERHNRQRDRFLRDADRTMRANKENSGAEAVVVKSLRRDLEDLMEEKCQMEVHYMSELAILDGEKTRTRDECAGTLATVKAEYERKLAAQSRTIQGLRNAMDKDVQQSTIEQLRRALNACSRRAELLERKYKRTVDKQHEVDSQRPRDVRAELLERQRKQTLEKQREDSPNLTDVATEEHNVTSEASAGNTDKQKVGEETSKVEWF